MNATRRGFLLVVAVLVCAFAVQGCSRLKRFGYEGFDRDSWQQPERVIGSLGIEPGLRVADIGAGGGYFTFRLADAVGSTGRVYAVDVDEDMTSYLQERAAEEGRSTVTVVLGSFDDPMLPDSSIDLVFTSNTYHHIAAEGRVAYFRRLRDDLAPGGRVVILELREGPLFVRSHFTPPKTIVAEMQQAGYRELTRFEFLEKQSFTVFGLE